MRRKDKVVTVLREKCLKRDECKHCLFYGLGNKVDDCIFPVQPWEWETKEEHKQMGKADKKVMGLIRSGEFEKLLAFMKALED